jgi:hypothetical protein
MLRFMKKKVLGAVGVLLLAGVVASGASCWKTVRNANFTESACTDGKFSLTSTFVPAYDFAELRQTGGQPTFRVLQSSGTCAGESCEAALKAATSSEGWSNGSNGRLPGHNYIVAMKGDKAFIVDGSSLTMGAALAPIDSPAKAAAVASIERNLGFDCEKAARKVEGGYEVHVSTDSCFGPRDEVIKVTTDGRTEVIRSDSSPGTCVGAAPTRSEPKYAAVTFTK